MVQSSQLRIFEAWTCTDQLIKSWIFGTLTEEVLGYVHGLATSQEVWLSLADNFNKSFIAREFDLRRRLQLLTNRGKDFLVYCQKFRAICDQLSSIGKPVEESMKIFTFLNGLGREYDPITHVGSTVLTTATGSIPLCDVLVCPSMQKSLLSVSKLCEDYPCGVFFDANAVYIIDLNTQKVVTKGPRREGLYLLQNSEFMAFYSNRQCAASDIIWHQRLGHTNFQVLQLLKSSKAISINKTSTSLVCEPCQMGKSSQLSFSYSESIVTEPLEQINCDLWGPSPVVSVQSFKYYVVFVDQFSRYSWIFL